jgi:hypothetical protein
MEDRRAERHAVYYLQGASRIFVREGHCAHALQMWTSLQMEAARLDVETTPTPIPCRSVFILCGSGKSSAVLSRKIKYSIGSI